MTELDKFSKLDKIIRSKDRLLMIEGDHICSSLERNIVYYEGEKPVDASESKLYLPANATVERVVNTFITNLRPTLGNGPVFASALATNIYNVFQGIRLDTSEDGFARLLASQCQQNLVSFVRPAIADLPEYQRKDIAKKAGWVLKRENLRQSSISS